jgi:hypothetical protein
MGGKAKDKICEECEPECLINGWRWAEHCSEVHKKDSKDTKYRYT